MCLLAIANAGLISAAHAAEYLIDRDHTEVRATWDHFGLTRQSAEFRDVIGGITFDPARPQDASVDITIKIASIASGVAALDRQLTETRDFFNAAQYPDATFKSTNVLLLGQTTANVTGDLTLNGITKPVTLSVVWKFTGAHPLASFNPIYSGVVISAFSARANVLRSDFGMTRAIPLVSDAIGIEIETELIQKAGSAAMPEVPRAAPQTGFGPNALENEFSTTEELPPIGSAPFAPQTEVAPQSRPSPAAPQTE